MSQRATAQIPSNGLNDPHFKTLTGTLQFNTTQLSALVFFFFFVTSSTGNPVYALGASSFPCSRAQGFRLRPENLKEIEEISELQPWLENGGGGRGGGSCPKIPLCSWRLRCLQGGLPRPVLSYIHTYIHFISAR